MANNQSKTGNQGGNKNPASDREKASEAGRMGGQKSGDSKTTEKSGDMGRKGGRS